MLNRIKSAAACVGTVGLILTIGALTTPPADADTTSTPAVDSVIHTYLGVHDLDVADQVLSDVGKADGNWWICRVGNKTPQLGYAEVVSDEYSDRLNFTAWPSIDMAPGQTAQAQIDATLCKLPVDTNAQRPVVHVAFVLTQPFNPDVQVYRNPVTNRCELSMKNQDPVLNAYMQLWQGAGPYDFYDPLYPGTPYTFRRHAPRKLWFSTNFYDPTVMKSGADIYGILSGELNTVKCTVKIFQSYK